LAVNFVVMRFHKDDEHLHQRFAKYISVRIAMILGTIRRFQERHQPVGYVVNTYPTTASVRDHRRLLEPHHMFEML
jgi:hypothetical protein